MIKLNFHSSNVSYWDPCRKASDIEREKLFKKFDLLEARVAEINQELNDCEDMIFHERAESKLSEVTLKLNKITPMTEEQHKKVNKLKKEAHDLKKTTRRMDKCFAFIKKL